MNKKQLTQLIREEIQSLLHENVKIGDKLKHKLTGAKMVVTKVSGDELTTKYTSVGTQPGAKVGGINKTSTKLIGKSYDIEESVNEDKHSNKNMTLKQIQKEMDELDKAMETMSRGGIEYDKAMNDWDELNAMKKKLEKEENDNN